VDSLFLFRNLDGVKFVNYF